MPTSALSLAVEVASSPLRQKNSDLRTSILEKQTSLQQSADPPADNQATTTGSTSSAHSVTAKEISISHHQCPLFMFDGLTCVR